MTDIERRALLGDKQAKEECTRQGIALACPFCGRSEETVFKLAHFNLYAHKRTGKCALDGMIIYNLSDWNTRPAPPIGRCGECSNACDVGDNLLRCDIFDRDMMPDDFCSQFEMKESEEANWLMSQVLHDINAMPTIGPETLPIVQELRVELESVTAERDSLKRTLTRACDFCRNNDYLAVPVCEVGNYCPLMGFKKRKDDLK